MPVDIKILGTADSPLFASVADGVFDSPVDPALAAEFLEDDRHHLAVAIDHHVIVGFASAVHYVHPDKPPELWVNEIGVAPSHRGDGIARQLMDALFEHGRKLRCREAWVLTDADNHPANSLYRSVGGSPSHQVMFSFRLTD